MSEKSLTIVKKGKLQKKLFGQENKIWKYFSETFSMDKAMTFFTAAFILVFHATVILPYLNKWKI